MEFTFLIIPRPLLKIVMPTFVHSFRQVPSAYITVMRTSWNRRKLLEPHFLWIKLWNKLRITIIMLDIFEQFLQGSMFRQNNIAIPEVGIWKFQNILTFNKLGFNSF